MGTKRTADKKNYGLLIKYDGIFLKKCRLKLLFEIESYVLINIIKSLAVLLSLEYISVNVLKNNLISGILQVNLLIKFGICDVEKYELIFLL